VKQALAKLGRDYTQKEMAIIAISANDPAGYPEDAPDRLKAMAEEEGFNFPFLFDESQEIAKAFTALATPDIFIFNQDKKLVYRGQFDDSRPNSGTEATGKDVREAIDALLLGQELTARQKPAIGCSIKWKPGATPDYAA
jgi:peroxiredoxin